MGLFDSFYAIVNCPFCKKIKEFEFQTKELSCGMNEYKLENIINQRWLVLKEAKIIGALASCECHPKKFEQNYFYADIIIKNGKFNSIEKIRKTEFLQERMK